MTGHGYSDEASCWPALPLASWRETCATLHMWTQVVGRVKVALTPLVNLAVLDFCQSTYEAAAVTGAWDRAAIER
jgi:hypothetical protein